MQTSTASSRSKGYLIALIGTAVWSSTAIFIRYLSVTQQMPPLSLAFWRDLMVCLAIAAFMATFDPRKLRIQRTDLPFFLLFGVVLTLFNSTWTVSVALNGAAVSTVLAYSSAAFTAILGWKFFKEELNWVKLTAVVLSLAGCVIVAGAYDRSAWQLNPLGISVGLVSGLAFALYSIMGRMASERGLPPLTTLLYSFAFGAAGLLGLNFLLFSPPAATYQQLFWLGTNGTAWLILVILALGPTIGGYGLYIVSLGYLPASIANLIATLEPGMTAVLAYFFLGERFSPNQLVGSGLILAGLLFLRWHENRQMLVPSTD
jgi:drug/metabolite transporter (DMT)-like permease